MNAPPKPHHQTPLSQESYLLPPLRAFIEAIGEFVYSGEVEALAAGSTPSVLQHHGQEVWAALVTLRKTVQCQHPGYRAATPLERALCMDLNNLLASLHTCWQHTCDSSDTSEARLLWCDLAVSLAQAHPFGREIVSVLIA